MDDVDLIEQFRRVRVWHPATDALALLHIGEEETRVVTGSAQNPQAIVRIKLGSRKTATDCFRRAPPTPAEMENAIMVVEDELMARRAQIDVGAHWVTSDRAIREIGHVAGLAAHPFLELHRDAVEATFGRLAAVTMGRPAAQDPMPRDLAFATTLLILREFMHHLDISDITIERLDAAKPRE